MKKTKHFVLKWRGCSPLTLVKAESIAKAKIKMAQAEGLNPLLVMDRIEAVYNCYTNDNRITKQLI